MDVGVLLLDFLKQLMYLILVIKFVCDGVNCLCILIKIYDILYVIQKYYFFFKNEILYINVENFVYGDMLLLK